MARNTAITAAAIAAVLGSVGAVSYLSPNSIPKDLQEAAERDDTYRIRQLIDFDSVRSSLTNLLYQDYMDNHVSPVPASEVSGIYRMAASMIAENLATPDTVVALYTDKPIHILHTDPDSRNLQGAFAPSQKLNLKPLYTYSGRYVNFNTYVWRATHQNGDVSFDIVAQRTGLFSWKVDRLEGDLAAGLEEDAPAPETIPAAQPAPTPQASSPIDPPRDLDDVDDVKLLEEGESFTFTNISKNIQCELDQDGVICVNGSGNAVICDGGCVMGYNTISKVTWSHAPQTIRSNRIRIAYPDGYACVIGEGNVHCGGRNVEPFILEAD